MVAMAVWCLVDSDTMCTMVSRPEEVGGDVLSRADPSAVSHSLSGSCAVVCLHSPLFIVKQGFSNYGRAAFVSVYTDI